ncbi:MAG: hypothetical protein ACI8S6_001838 [Myxococcota bacterium]|jgi:hypothetical protein
MLWVLLSGCGPSLSPVDAVPVMGMDHDPVDYEGSEQLYCTSCDGSGFPYCYDGHDGSDFDLIDGFETMDEGSATVVAAAAGTVVETEDGHYDRCRLDPQPLGPTCDGHEMAANLVTVEHTGGHRTTYKHLMQWSVAVTPGDQVERGATLGRVGSSGCSTAPHVHLELLSPTGERIDPFAGPYSQDYTWWCEQDGPDGLPGDLYP